MKREDILSSNAEVMGGTLVFARTRVPVAVFIQHLIAGDSLEVFLEDFPSVNKEQAIAFLEMALTEAGKNYARSA